MEEIAQISKRKPLYVKIYGRHFLSSQIQKNPYGDWSVILLPIGAAINLQKSFQGTLFWSIE